MTTTNSRKGRMRLLLIAAAAFASSAMSLGGALGALWLQHPSQVTAETALV